MARTEVPVVSVTRDGYALADITEIDGDPTNGMYFAQNAGRTFLYIRNIEATLAATITFITPGEVDGLSVEDLYVGVPAGSTYLVSGLAGSTFNQEDGSVYFDLSHHSWKIRAFKT